MGIALVGEHSETDVLIYRRNAIVVMIGLLTRFRATPSKGNVDEGFGTIGFEQV